MTPPPRVLVLDDDYDTQRFVGEALRGVAQVIGQSNAYRARRVLSLGRFDVLVLDLILSGANGLDFLERLPPNDRPPRVIVLSGWRDGMDAARQLGVQMTLQKPCTADALREAVLRPPVGAQPLSELNRPGHLDR